MSTTVGRSVPCRICCMALTLVLAIVVADGCVRARRGTDADRALPVAGPPFHPTSYLATPQIANDARYRDLMASDSYMIWVSDDVARIKFAQDAAVPPVDVVADGAELADARLINASFLVFELHLKSVFGDPSIANEFTRMEHVQLFLVDDTSQKIRPSGTVVSKAIESDRGPLREFARTVIIAFPRYDIMTGNPTVRPETAHIRVYIQGYDTVYMFEWTSAELQQEERTRLHAGQLAEVVHWGYSEFYGALQAIFRNFK